MTHDNYPLDKNFKKNLESVAKSRIYNNFGLIGFNHLDYRMTRNAIKLWKKKKFSYGLLGRIFLSKRLTGENWYNQTIINKNHKAYKDVFSVECVSDMAFLINRDLFSRYIKPSSSFKLHLWADDIALQFMKNNIYNAVDRRIFFFNCQEIKRKYSISVNSVDGAKNNDIEFNTYGSILLQYLQTVFPQRNEFEDEMVLRFKHRHDSKTLKAGLRLKADNKAVFCQNFKNFTNL
jgi:hypothetical protein